MLWEELKGGSADGNKDVCVHFCSASTSGGKIPGEGLAGTQGKRCKERKHEVQSPTNWTRVFYSPFSLEICSRKTCLRKGTLGILPLNIFSLVLVRKPPSICTGHPMSHCLAYLRMGQGIPGPTAHCDRGRGGQVSKAAEVRVCVAIGLDKAFGVFYWKRVTEELWAEVMWSVCLER